MSYRDILARRERRRPDGTPVWPLTDADLSSRTQGSTPPAGKRPAAGAFGWTLAGKVGA